MTDNKRRARTIEIDVADAYMLVHAMAIARNTAMMCDHPGARRRFEAYRVMFMAMVPDAAKLMRDEEDWAEIAMALDEAEEWSLVYGTRNSWDRTGHATVAIGGRTWTTGWDGITPAQADEIADGIADLAPLTCRRKEGEVRYHVPADEDAE